MIPDGREDCGEAVTSAFAQAGRTRRVIRQLATIRAVAWLSARLLPRLDQVVFRATRGRLTFSAWLTGLPVIVLTTIGARSGRARHSRVLAVPDGEQILVVASNFGQRTNPAWCHNLRANLHVSVSSAASAPEREYVARELQGAERERAYRLAVAMNPGWLRYQQQASPRVIPVFQLEPLASSTDSSPTSAR